MGLTPSHQNEISTSAISFWYTFWGSSEIPTDVTTGSRVLSVAFKY